MKVEMCVWSSVCTPTAQPNAADESWLHFVMREQFAYSITISECPAFMFSFQQSPCFADGIIDMGRQNTWEKVK